MALLRLSRRAGDDLRGIYRYTFQEFGEAKAEAYVALLQDRLALIADNPRLGQAVDHIRNGYRRFEAGSHAIYYQESGDVVLVQRFLHKRMDANRSL